eukprot:CAMPEP_0172611334 /NCGR_PEP_ID=MMETSP1068-20121228/31039_1 /TAXON_ID=35684 /ORGANISM="Pseudopedinella elastica, Strain CCMP716" /LENGTH=163 /DNA_ID=CAMNT_0013415281 /DNA_START=180 /DNA_END=668 /DNA_ORIENTATION=+
MASGPLSPPLYTGLRNLGFGLCVTNPPIWAEQGTRSIDEKNPGGRRHPLSCLRALARPTSPSDAAATRALRTAQDSARELAPRAPVETPAPPFPPPSNSMGTPCPRSTTPGTCSSGGASALPAFPGNCAWLAEAQPPSPGPGTPSRAGPLPAQIPGSTPIGPP